MYTNMILKNIAIGKKWTTHIPMLLKTVQMTEGPILELGAGLYSTPLLHWLCAETGRELWTYDSVEEYYEFARRFQSRNHRIRFTKDFKELDTKKQWSVVFVDHWPEKQRGLDTIKLKDNAEYIVLHDSEEEEKHGYEKAWEHFKYRYDWKFCTPHTTVLSNFNDLSELYE